MKCIKCNKEFESQRKSAKFCSTSCRVMFNKSLSVNSEDEVSVNKPPTIPVSVNSPEETKIISVNKYEDMDDKALWAEADRMATREYLARGWFGGRRSYKSNTIKYFPFQQVMEQFYRWLKDGQEGVKPKKLDEVEQPAEEQWKPIAKCENCFKLKSLTEAVVPTYDKDSGEMIEVRKMICDRCLDTLQKVKNA